MKTIFRLLLFVATTAIFASCYSASSKASSTNFKSGDIIFQSSQSKQCSAVRIATRSIYSHCGIIFVENSKVYVYEAVGPVKKTPFSDWIQHGKDSKYIVRRLKNDSLLTNAGNVSKMKAIRDKYMGKNYDLCFEWSDNKIYCSEYVWKIYKQALNIEVGRLQKLKDFDLSSKEVKYILNERYGDKIPMEETVISPQSIFESELLVTVEDTY